MVGTLKQIAIKLQYSNQYRFHYKRSECLPDFLHGIGLHVCSSISFLLYYLPLSRAKEEWQFLLNNVSDVHEIEKQIILLSFKRTFYLKLLYFFFVSTLRMWALSPTPLIFKIVSFL